MSGFQVKPVVSSMKLREAVPRAPSWREIFTSATSARPVTLFPSTTIWNSTSGKTPPTPNGVTPTGSSPTSILDPVHVAGPEEREARHGGLDVSVHGIIVPDKGFQIVIRGQLDRPREITPHV